MLKHLFLYKYKINTTNRLAKNGKAIEELAVWINHELNNFNQAGMALTEKMQNQNPEELSSETYQYMLKKIMGAFEKIGDIMEIISEYSKSGIKPKETQCSKIIGESVTRAYDTFINRYDEKVRLEKITDNRDDMPISVDKGMLEIAIFNMIKNAYQSVTQRMAEQPENQEKGVIKIHSACSNGKLKIIVEDNGKGISQRNIKKICNRNFTTKSTGKGIGLFLADRVARDHGGKLTVKSNENKWARVTITIPV